jgi:tetratricopeptide (TPR) repeat protein
VTRGTRAEIQTACALYGYQPLALRLLSGLIAHDKRQPGDIVVAERIRVLPYLKGKEQHHILQVAYDELDEDKRKLVSSIAAFRNPVTYDTLAIFNPCKTPEEFDAVLDELIGRGLLLFDKERRLYDMHPIVRQYAYDRLTDKGGVHSRLRDYFAAVPKIEEEKVQCIEDLAPVIELYHHTVRAGRYDEACDLFYERLNKILFFRFGAYQTCIELLRALFPDGEDQPPRLKKESDQAWTLNELANSYTLSGQSRRAVPLLERHNALWEKAGDKKKLAIGLENLAYQQILLGELAAAEKNLRRSIELCREIKHEFSEAVGHQELARVLAHRGVFDESAQELNTAEEMLHRLGQTQAEGIVWAYCALLGLFRGKPADALEADRCEYRLKQADVHNFLARLDLEAGDRTSALRHAQIAYERAWCDGPPHCYKPALDEAQRLLTQLGVAPHGRTSV